MHAHIEPLNICIVSRKNIFRNTRVVRQAGALSDAGHHVTVVCFAKPHPELLASVPRVRFVEISQETASSLGLERIRPHLDLDVLVALPPMRATFDLWETFILWRINKVEKRGDSFSNLAQSATGLACTGRWGGVGGRHLKARGGFMRGWQKGKLQTKVAIYNGVERLPGGPMAWEGYRWAKRSMLPRASEFVARLYAPKRGTGLFPWLRTRLVDPLDRLAIAMLDRRQRSEIAKARQQLRAVGAQHPNAGLEMVITRLADLDPVSYAVVLGLVEQNVLLDVGFGALAIKRLGDVRFDYVQSHDYTSLLSAEYIRRRLGGELIYDAVEISEHRAIADEHMDIHRATKDDIYRRIEAAIFLKSGKLLTVGEKLSEWYAEAYGIEPPCVLRNCRYYSVPANDQRLRRDCGVGPGTPLLLWFGGGYPKQGIAFAIEILARMRDDAHLAMLTEFMPAWKWYEEELHALVAAKGLLSRVHFLPLRPPNELLSYASGASVGLIPRPKSDVLNVEYSLPNKLFELIMSRTPIAATDLPNVQQIIRKYDIGCTLVDGDPDMSAAAVQTLLDEVEKGNLAPRLERAARDLCWEKESQRLVAFYAERSGFARTASPRVAVEAYG